MAEPLVANPLLARLPQPAWAPMRAALRMRRSGSCEGMHQEEIRHMRDLTTGMKSKRAAGTLALFTGVALSALASQPAAAQGKQLTLCWAAWDPANALVELGKDFTKQSGVEM